MSFKKSVSIRFKGLRSYGRFKKRYDVINYFLRARNSETYLEIGVGSGRCMERVQSGRKTGVDPSPRRVLAEWEMHQMTSDAFFATNTSKFDLIFIDGLHTSDQVIKDIFNALAALAKNGVIAVHDCNPMTEEAQVRDRGVASKGEWSGDVWKAIVFFRKSLSDVFCRVFPFDHGVAVIIPHHYETLPVYTPEIEREALQFFREVTWADLHQDRKNLLGLMENRSDFEREFRNEQLKRMVSQ